MKYLHMCIYRIWNMEYIILCNESIIYNMHIYYMYNIDYVYLYSSRYIESAQ